MIVCRKVAKAQRDMMNNEQGSPLRLGDFAARNIGFRIRRGIVFLSICMTQNPIALAGEWSGQIGAEYRGFIYEPLLPEQHQNYFSLYAQPEYRHRWDNDKQGIAFVPFARVAQHDEQRTHADIRELAWFKAGEGYEWRAGIRKVFWGVTESQHLVDIINQTDLVENIDGEEKLGQPMINLALIRSWGTLDLYILTGSRERTFPGREGRLRTALPVDTEQAVYESNRGRRRLDYAARWHKSLGNWEIGLAHFAGTARDPRLLPGLGSDGTLALIPYYDVIDQTSLDIQVTQGAWLWKLETIRRAGQGPTYAALTAGFEYTLTGIFDSGVDLGLLAEYLHDDRGTSAPTPFQNDVFAGLRLAFNDVASSEALVGIIADRDSDAHLISLEASRRLGKGSKISLEGRWFSAVPATDLLYSQRRDDYVQLELAHYF